MAGESQGLDRGSQGRRATPPGPGNPHWEGWACWALYGGPRHQSSSNEGVALYRPSHRRDAGASQGEAGWACWPLPGLPNTPKFLERGGGSLEPSHQRITRVSQGAGPSLTGPGQAPWAGPYELGWAGPAGPCLGCATCQSSSNEVVALWSHHTNVVQG